MAKKVKDDEDQTKDYSDCELITLINDTSEYERRMKCLSFVHKSFDKSLGELLKDLMVLKNRRTPTLSAKSYISENTIDKIRKGITHNYNLNIFMCICIGLNLEPELSKLLLSKAHLSVDDRIEYQILLNQYYHTDIDSWNYLLKSWELPILGESNKKTRDENLAYLEKKVNGITKV